MNLLAGSWYYFSSLCDSWKNGSRVGLGKCQSDVFRGFGGCQPFSVSYKLVHVALKNWAFFFLQDLMWPQWQPLWSTWTTVRKVYLRPRCLFGSWEKVTAPFTVKDNFYELSSLSSAPCASFPDKDELCEEVQSRMWFSYRKDFGEIGQSGLNSDRGWGCMLRCGQMVLAESLIRYFYVTSSCSRLKATMQDPGTPG